MTSLLQLTVNGALGKRWIQKCTPISFVALGMRSEENARNMKNKQLVSPWRKCSSTPGGFRQGFLSKDQFDNTGASPILSWLVSADFYMFFPMKSAFKWQRFCNAIDIKNATEELKRFSQNDFQECFQHRYSPWQKCVFAQWHYFEDNVG